MNYKKIFTSKIGIAIVFVVITILAILGFSVICKRGGSYMFRDRRGEVKENFRSGEKVFDLSENETPKQMSSSLIFRGDAINNTYSIHDEDHKIEIAGNVIKVDDVEIFGTDKILRKVYLIDDILMVDVIGANDIKLNLIFFDIKGNTVKKVDGITNYYVHDTTIEYAIDDYVPSDSNIIYEMHAMEDADFKYLGEYMFSDEKHSMGRQDILYGDTVLYDKDGLRIKYVEKCDFEKSNDTSCHVKPYIHINGGDVEIAPVLVSVQKLYDGYLMVESCYQDGYTLVTYIIDQNGNLITNFNELIGDNQFTSHSLIPTYDKSYDNGYFYIYTVDSESSYVTYFEDVCTGYDAADVLGRNYKFKYLGNGKVDKGTIIDEVTVNDYLKKYPQHCE